MMFRFFRAAIIAMVTVGPEAAAAQEAACRAVETWYMQLQASGRDSGEEADDVRRIMADRGCRVVGPKKDAVSEARPRIPATARQRSETSRKVPRPTAKRPDATKPDIEPAPPPSPRSRPPANARKLREAEEAPPTTEVRLPRSAPGRTYRTWCVRTCDGFYFPISFSTTRSHLKADQASCQKMCPAAEAELFYHAAGSEPQEDMTSLSGGTYGELPSAFRYRSAVDPSCSCEKPLETPRPAPRKKQSRKRPIERAPTFEPLPRPSPGEDPETLANRSGNFTLAPQDRAASASGRRQLEQSVRVVWPDLRDEQGAIVSAVPNPGF